MSPAQLALELEDATDVAETLTNYQRIDFPGLDLQTFLFIRHAGELIHSLVDRIIILEINTAEGQ